MHFSPLSPVDGAPNGSGLFYRDFLPGQHFIDSFLEVLALDGASAARTVVYGTMIYQFAIFVKQVAFRRAGGTKCLNQFSFVKGIEPGVSLLFGISLHIRIGISALPVTFVGVEKDHANIVFSCKLADFICPCLITDYIW